jgi:hypothetical protein
MPEPITGGCACGAVRYSAEAEPIAMINCHCRDCQRASGSAFSPIVVVPRAAVRMDGDVRYHASTGEGGGVVERGFCPVCGSPVSNKLGRMPDVFGLVAASLDDPSLHRPTVELFTDSANAWDHLAPDTQKLPRGMG